MIHANIVLINSDQDSTNFEAFRKYHLLSELRIIPNVYHYIHWEAPEKFNLVLEESIQEIMSRRNP